VHLEALALVPMGWGAEAILWVARTTSALPDATIEVPHIPAWGLCIFSVGLAWLGLWRTRRRLAGLVLMVAGLASPLLDRPPDLLISDDGRLIAVRTPQGAFLQQTQGGSKFTRDAWAQYWAIGSFQMIPSSSSSPGVSGVSVAARAGIDGLAKLAPDDGSIHCEPDACLLRPYPDRPGAMLVRGALHPKFCDQSSVIVSAEPARGLCPRPWPALVDRFTVWRYGSVAIWLDRDGARVLTDRTERGDRPWVPPPPKPRKPATSTLPQAAVDRPVTPMLPQAAIDRPTVADRVEQPGPVPDVPPADANNGE
jgi:competence protein ComEC